MHSLLILNKFTHKQFNLLALTKFAIFERNSMFPRRICATLCNSHKPNVHLQIGQPQYSTIKENVATKQNRNLKRRRYYQKKTLTNVTEVTSSSVLQTNRLVPVLTVKQLHALFDPKPDKEIETNEKPSVISNTKIKSSNRQEEVENITNSQLDAREKTAVSEEKPKVVTSPTTTHSGMDDREAKAILQNLRALLNVCCVNDWTGSGLTILLSYRKTRRNGKIEPIDVDLFHILMNSYACKGNIKKILEICTVFRDDSIPFTPQFYAFMFECIGRRQLTSKCLEQLQKFKRQADRDKISFNRIMNESKFVRDQREITLKAIREIEPTFEPVYTAPLLTYSNHLVDSLNSNIKPIGQDATVDVMEHKRASSRGDIHEMMQGQLETELRGRITIKSIAAVPADVREKIDRDRQKIEDLFKNWHLIISKSFRRDLNSLQHHYLSRGFNSVNANPYLRALNAEHFVDVLMEEVKYLVKNCTTFTPATSHLYVDLGRKVMLRYQIEMKVRNGIVDKTTQIYEKYCNILLNSNTTDNARQIWQRLEHDALKSGPSLNVDDQLWPNAVLLAIGKFLYNILLRDLKIDVSINQIGSMQRSKPYMVPVFYTLLRHRDKTLKEEIKVHPAFIKLYQHYEFGLLNIDANLIPMMSPPLPWTSPKIGAYLVMHSDLIRLPYVTQLQLERIRNSPKCNLYPVLDSLNQLARVPWKINTRILDVLIKVFNSGGSEKLNVAQPASIVDEELAKLYEKSESAKYQEIQKLKQRKSELYSIWCDALYRLSLANHYRDKKFWLPQNMDFRGRVYPLPPHLNHIGSDYSRCLFLFHEGRPLGKDGYRWLKLHCINLIGHKKKSPIAERLAYAEEVLDDIIDSADNPLTGRMWWAESEDPWQTLACCMEIADVSRCPDPAKHICHLPIHQDGSCNGLQHYAALGRDQIGAMSVNLSNMPKPQDVYAEVAAKVEKIRKFDALSGDETAIILKGFITRKVVKQVVMTTVYGVTRFGARLQIERQLKNLDNFPPDFVQQASIYLTKNTFVSLRAMFTSAKEIQDWFTQCARLISGIRLQHVEWITPLGLPVFQPYSKPPSNSAIASKYTEKSKARLKDMPNMAKQKNAFPPNFIHSLDSTHMMLTSLNCEKAGILFVSVHDCFWTHPSSVTEMNKICRNQFVLLHSQPILEDLSNFFVKKYGFDSKEYIGNASDIKKDTLNVTVKNPPKKGAFKLENVLDSVYFFS